MTKEAKAFTFALEQCRAFGGMEWYGAIPPEIAELFDIKLRESAHSYQIGGLWVKVLPQYKPWKPDWDNKKELL